MIRIALSGTLGKMGKVLIKEIKKSIFLKLTVAIVSKRRFLLKKKNLALMELEQENVFISTSVKDKLKEFDVLIDFSSVEKAIDNINICCLGKKKVVIGTTGFNEDEENLILQASNIIGIVKSSNFSIGINLLLSLLEKTVKIIGLDSDIEIVEEHHNRKKDSPSGTALTLGKRIAEVMNCNFNDIATYSRVGKIGSRKKKTIGFSVVRAGNIVGNHKIIFANESEHVIFSHKAIDRSIFSKGVIKAVSWIMSKDHGLFSMSDVLNI